MPRITNRDTTRVEERIRSLERKVDDLRRTVAEMTPSGPTPVAIGDDVTIVYAGSDYTLLEGTTNYQTPKDGQQSILFDETAYGHYRLELFEGGTGKWLSESRVYWSSEYTQGSSKIVTWEVVDGEIVISG